MNYVPLVFLLFVYAAGLTTFAGHTVFSAEEEGWEIAGMVFAVIGFVTMLYSGIFLLMTGVS